MDFVRFSGELFIYYALMALGGGVLTAFTLGMFQAIGIDASRCSRSGAALRRRGRGAGRRLAGRGEAERDREHGAGADAALHALVRRALIVFLGTMAWTGRGIDIERDALITFDLLLGLVLGLLLYSISARDPQAPPGVFDFLLVVLLVSALVADAFALAAIAARISEFGFTPNRVAALGFNVVLLVNLAWSACSTSVPARAAPLPARALADRLPAVYSAWAAIVVVASPRCSGSIEAGLSGASAATVPT